MDATTALQCITNCTITHIEGDDAARERLTAALTEQDASLDRFMEAVMVTTATAKPWRDLLRNSERYGVREALARQRKQAMDTLLHSYGFALSPDLIANAARIAEQDGLRRFLSATEGFEVDDETAPTPEAPGLLSS